ncbi:MAG: 2-hydroxy-6-oxo-6-phenylhexa-2,4-dienoate hydrolase [Cycloclasticus sp.]|nr:2-hydroxy-6-oxo-6-phenylhexa-2,4-dienoate hydrolase [Cycloclasticus sp.]MBG96666.1 2-hydroxy-6-oxo-6-phenylhexa-2,4-dienoate hydrolase [Cycloclasticus sp.]HAI96003.1 2-hydroxy-6-oxo-6-phenylhexa-2,4-dienoate hydrolase [Methylococcaceae bacterium]|tara:strand:- start:363 stop:1226 length:864 start_codon:yes stop_codon:yes gene_type:complete
MSFEMVEKMIPSGELASNCIIAGNPENPPLLLLHGAGPGASAMSNWEKCAPILAKDFYVIAPDAIGFGKSEMPKDIPTKIARWMGYRVEQIKGLLNELGIEKTHIIGNSMGGALAMQCVVEMPDRFDKCMLMGAIGAPFEKSATLTRMMTFYDDPRKERYRELIQSFVYDPSIFEDLEAVMQDRFDKAMDPKIRPIQEVMFKAMNAEMNTVLVIPPPILASMDHEWAIVHGRQDKVVPLETSMYFLEHLKHAELHVLDRCGHWAQTQRWDGMYPIIMAHFLGKEIRC